jgi:SAM-dependent methyltransferase
MEDRARRLSSTLNRAIRSARMPRRYQQDWDELARREPYFAVLTDRRFLRAGLDETTRRQFFETGQADVEHLFAVIREHASRAFEPATALDFGCGVGRVTLALSALVPSVTGCDISPEMIAIARQNAAAMGRFNVMFEMDLDALRDRQFDLICSLIVFQHIPPSEGMITLTKLMRLMAPGGIAAIHFTLRRPGTPLRRLARCLRGAFPLLHRAALRLEGDDLQLPYMQMNEYDEREIRRRVENSGRTVQHLIPRDEGGVAGAVFIVARQGLVPG